MLARIATSKLVCMSELLYCGNKTLRDTGTKMRLRRWARGVFVTVAGGGIIKHWAPLYKSESPSQVK